MSTRFFSMGLVAGAGMAFWVSAADAALFKGIAVITNRSAVAACINEYDIGESFVVEYRGNVGTETSPETLAAIGPNGAILLTSNDSTPTLRGTGSGSLLVIAYAQTTSLASTASNLAITSPITADTRHVTITGTVNHLGIANCHVTFRASLTLLPPGGF